MTAVLFAAELAELNFGVENLRALRAAAAAGRPLVDGDGAGLGAYANRLPLGRMRPASWCLRAGRAECCEDRSHVLHVSGLTAEVRADALVATFGGLDRRDIGWIDAASALLAFPSGLAARAALEHWRTERAAAAAAAASGHADGGGVGEGGAEGDGAGEDRPDEGEDEHAEESGWGLPSGDYVLRSFDEYTAMYPDVFGSQPAALARAAAPPPPPPPPPPPVEGEEAGGDAAARKRAAPEGGVNGGAEDAKRARTGDA